MYRFNPSLSPLDNDYKKMFVDVVLLPTICAFTIHSNTIYCLTSDPNIVYEIDTELNTITPQYLTGISIPEQENIPYGITSDDTNLYISSGNTIYRVQNYTVTNYFTIDICNPITDLFFHGNTGNLYFFTKHLLNDTHDYFGYIQETPILLSLDFAINETPYETLVCSYHNDFIYFNYTILDKMYMGQYSILNNSLTSIYMPNLNALENVFAGITFDDQYMYVQTHTSVIYKTPIFCPPPLPPPLPIHIYLKDYFILSNYSLILQYLNGNVIVNSGKYSIEDNRNITPSFSKDNKLLPNAIQELTSFYNTVSTINPTYVIPLNYKYLPIIVTNLFTTIDEMFTFTPGKWIAKTVGQLTFNDLTIKSNTTIVFNGDSDSVFIIQARNILVENNVTFILKDVNPNNIFWITNKNIQIDSTTFKGTVITNHLICNQLNLTGHVYVTTVTGKLSIINDIPVPIISDICFAHNTPIETDQGIIFVQDLNPSLHTIHDEPISVTNTISLDNFLICFEKHTFERNCPSQRTIVSKDHKIKYKDKFISAYKLMIPRFMKFIHKIPYDGQPLYTVFLKIQTSVRANNLVCETIHTVNAQIYANNRLMDKHIYNESIYLKHENQKNTIRNLYNRYSAI
jgi:hypothetical protein